jgi:hypothetical protein
MRILNLFELSKVLVLLQNIFFKGRLRRAATTGSPSPPPTAECRSAATGRPPPLPPSDTDARPSRLPGRPMTEAGWASCTGRAVATPLQRRLIDTENSMLPKVTHVLFWI